MANPKLTFRSRNSREQLEKIVDTLVARGGASTWDLAQVTGLHMTTIGAYLKHLQEQGGAHCAVPAQKSQCGTIHAQWAPGKAAVDPDDRVDDLPRRVVVRKEWEPNHVRNRMDCYLFGTPAVLEIAA